MKSKVFIFVFVLFLGLGGYWGYRFLVKKTKRDLQKEIRVEFSLKEFILIHGIESRSRKEFILKSVRCSYDKNKDSFFL